jgi:AcrR family transcriptional regulator
MVMRTYVLVTMAYPDYVRQHARRLRVEKLLSIDEIAERLALSRTTIYYWVGDLPLERDKRWTVGRQKGTAAMQAKFKLLRDEAYARGMAEYDELIKLPTFRDFVALYIAEGVKRNRNTVAICNSDERIVAMATGWMRQLSGREPSFSIQYHADQDLDALRTFWGGILEIDGSAIRMQRKSNSGQLNGRTWRSEHGVLTVQLGDTLLRARLQAWIDHIRAEWGLDSAPSHGAWRSLVSRTVWVGEDPGSNPGAPIVGDQ